MKQLKIFNPEELKATPRGIKRHKAGLCCTPRCKNNHRKGGWFCMSCTQRAWRYNNPIEAYLRDKKWDCKRRGVEWLIDDEWFKNWAKEKGLIEHMKLDDFAACWRVDRIRTNNPDGSKAPYTPDNIQCMPHGQNSIKEQYRRKYGSDAAAVAFSGVEVDRETGEIINVYKFTKNIGLAPIFLPELKRLPQPVAADDNPPF